MRIPRLKYLLFLLMVSLTLAGRAAHPSAEADVQPGEFLKHWLVLKPVPVTSERGKTPDEAAQKQASEVDKMVLDPYGGIQVLRGKATGAFHLEKAGERYLMGDHPDAVIQEALPHVDVLSIQPLGMEFNGELFDRLHRLTGKPIMLCDHQCSFATADYPKTMWQQLESEAAVGQAYAHFLERAFAKPYIVGFHRCQYIDRFVQYQGVLKQGLLRENGRPYEVLVSHVRDANLEQMRRFAKPQVHERTMGNTGATPH